MKLVYCIAGTYRSGGMERVLANKANYLVDKGYDVSIITTDQRGQKPFFSFDQRIKFYDLAINYEENNGKSIWNKLWHYPAKQQKHKKRLSKLLNEIKADVVVSMFCNDVSFITDIKDGSKKVLEIHFSKYKRLQYNRKGLWRLADEWRSKNDEKLVRRFDKFIVLTEEDQSYWGYLPNIQVIPNAQTFSSSELAELDNKKVIAIGRFSHQKAFDRLIDIWNIVCRETEDWHLDIVGDGEMKEALQKQIDDFGISDRISLIAPSQNMPQLYLNASLLVLTSRYEGLPMILLEAQSFGLPIVAFQCKCGPKDVITDGVDGFLIPENENRLFADKVIALLKNDWLRKKMGKEAKVASERYSEVTIMKKWIKLFDLIPRQ